jgi:ParB family transcriptional regulator, chromosome partitioning protein
MTKLNALNKMLGSRLEADATGHRRSTGCAFMHGAYDIDLGRITPDQDQVRRQFDQDELNQLAASLRDVGQLQPVTVRYDDATDRYVLIAGERRYRAAVIAGLPRLRAIVDNGPADRDRITHLQLVENALRVDVTPLESAVAYRQLMEAWGCTQIELAARLNVSQSKVSRTLAVLDLPADVQQEVATGATPSTVAVKRGASSRGRRPGARKGAKVSCPAGTAVVTPRAGFTVAQVLEQLLDNERRRAA